MAGHSHWNNVRRQKEKVDAKRGKVFTKILKEITVAVRLGGPDSSSNIRLRSALESARSENIPKDTLERAIKKGSGELGAQAVEEIRYEGYGPGGVAVMVACITDNRNRTAGEVRHAFSKCGGQLGTDGSVSYLFEEKGILIYPAHCGEEKILEAALEAGAEDITALETGEVEVTTAPEVLNSVKMALETAGFMSEQAEVTFIASTQAPVEGETAEKVFKLLNLLEELEDVQHVSCNAEFPKGFTGSGG